MLINSKTKDSTMYCNNVMNNNIIILKYTSTFFKFETLLKEKIKIK